MLRFCAIAFLVAAAPAGATEKRAVAITFDDVPAPGNGAPYDGPPLGTADVRSINESIIKVLGSHHTPATGLVNERAVAGFPDAEARRAILKEWIDAGLDLGNHTYAHLDFNDESLEQFEAEVVKGEASFVPLMTAANRKDRFFRFPFNHAGDTAQKHEGAAAFLKSRGYTLATCTIENEDYEFERALRFALEHRDVERQKSLRAAYVQYTADEIDYYVALHKQLFGRETAHVMLLHANRINALELDSILKLFEARGFRFVTLAEAQSDPAFKTQDDFGLKYGWMWSYRWARTLGAKVDGSKEKEPPAWVTSYGRPQAGATKAP